MRGRGRVTWMDCMTVESTVRMTPRMDCLDSSHTAIMTPQDTTKRQATSALDGTCDCKRRACARRGLATVVCCTG